MRVERDKTNTPTALIMRFNLFLIILIIVTQTALYSLKYAPFDVFKAIYNDIVTYDRTSAACWVLVSVLVRRLSNHKILNELSTYKKQVRIFQMVSSMMIALTIGGFINEMSGSATDPKSYMENLIWAILVFCYYIAVITIYCVKLYRLGRFY